MTRWKRTDLDVQAEVIEWLVNWKLWSDIAKNLWIHESTVSRIKDTKLQEVASESEKVAELIDRNNSLQSAADALIAKMIAEEHQSVTIAQLTTLRQSTFTQNQLLTGKATERLEVTGYDIIKDISSGKIKRDDAYALLDQVQEEDQ